MPFVSATDNQALNAVIGTNPGGSLAAYASLHGVLTSSGGSGYSATGANELTGGSPAYARVALTWASGGASGGSLSLQSTPSAFNVPAGYTVQFVGLWSASTSGTFGGMGANGGATMYSFTAATSGNLFTAPGSSYSNGTAVVIWSGVGATTPGGFTVGNIYYVISASGATFSLSATSGGSAVTVSAAGSGLVQAITLESFGAQGTFQLSADTLSLV